MEILFFFIKILNKKYSNDNLVVLVIRIFIVRGNYG